MQRKQEAAERRAEGLAARVEEVEGELDDAMQRCEIMQERHDDDAAAAAAAAAAPSSPKSMEQAVAQLLPAAEEGKRQGQDTTAELQAEV